MMKKKHRFYFSSLISIFCSLVAVSNSYSLTLEKAMDIAVKNNLKTQIAQTTVEIAKGNLIEDQSYAYNPELSIEPQKRVFRDGSTYNDYYIGLSQGIETAGKSTYRKNVAKERLNVDKHGVRSTELQLKFDAAYAYIDLFIANKRLEVRRKQFQTAQKLSKAVNSQLEVGEITSIQANLVKASLATALSTRSTEERAVLRAENNFRIALSLEGNQEAQERLQLPHPNVEWIPPVNTLNLIRKTPIYNVAETIEKVHAAEVKLASANRIPDVTVSLMTADEAGDRLYKFGISIPIPLFNSHTGSYKAALARNKRAELNKDLLGSILENNAKTAVKKHFVAMKALKDYQEGGLKNALANSNLAQQAYEAGELGLVETVVHISQNLEAELTGIEILHQAWLARTDLSKALGHPEYIWK